MEQIGGGKRELVRDPGGSNSCGQYTLYFGIRRKMRGLRVCVIEVESRKREARLGHQLSGGS